MYMIFMFENLRQGPIPSPPPLPLSIRPWFLNPWFGPKNSDSDFSLLVRYGTIPTY